jgi:hypothetical protein
MRTSRSQEAVTRGSPRDDRSLDSRLSESRDAEDDAFDPASAMSNVLPKPDPIPGYSFLWVPLEFGGETNHQVLHEKLHPISGGYEVVRPDEVRGFYVTPGELSAGQMGIVYKGNVLLKIKLSRRAKIEQYYEGLSRQAMRSIRAARHDEEEPGYNGSPRVDVSLTRGGSRRTPAFAE